MNAKSRRKIEMGRRALDFSRAHPDASPGFAAAVARLEARLARADQLARQQREGLLDVRAATMRKRELRRTMKRSQLAHVARVARVAARELPELAQKFVLKPGFSYLAFRTAAGAMAAEARLRKELLVSHGLVESVVESLAQSLAEFDAAVHQGTEGRQAHVGASAELIAVADEVFRLVNAMDGHNRDRFRNEAELLAAWESASSVLAGAKPAPGKPAPEPPAAPGGEIRPAA